MQRFVHDVPEIKKVSTFENRILERMRMKRPTRSSKDPWKASRMVKNGRMGKYNGEAGPHLFGPDEFGRLRRRLEQLDGDGWRVAHGVAEQRRQKLEHLDADSSADQPVGHHPSRHLRRAHPYGHVALVAEHIQQEGHAY